MFGLSLPEVVGVCVGLITIFSAVTGGVVWLITILMTNAVAKGDTQAEAIKEDIQEMGLVFTSNLQMIAENLTDKITSNETSSKERHEAISTRLMDHNKNITTRLDDYREEQGRHLAFIKKVDDKTVKNRESMSKLSNRVSRIEGRAYQSS